jgi:hypothetical protein
MRTEAGYRFVRRMSVATLNTIPEFWMVRDLLAISTCCNGNLLQNGEQYDETSCEMKVQGTMVSWCEECMHKYETFISNLQCVLAAKILTVDFVVCTLAVKKKIRASFVMSDRTIPLWVSWIVWSPVFTLRSRLHVSFKVSRTDISDPWNLLRLEIFPKFVIPLSINAVLWRAVPFAREEWH